MPSTGALYALALAVRLCFVAWGHWQDTHFAHLLPYTDVDYHVFNDAAGHVLAGESPYLRPTYRYPPLLAWLLVPNFLLHPCFGKVLFSVADVWVGRLIEVILRMGIRSGEKTTAVSPMFCAKLWLFNPLAVNICTRGSADAVSMVLILLALYGAMARRDCLAAAAFGGAVHLRVYPIIYGTGFVVWLGTRQQVRRRANMVWALLRSRRMWLFSLSSAAVFGALTAGCHWLYPGPAGFFQNALRYHVGRTDHRHNFSLYWYTLYQNFGQPASRTGGLLAFVPQVVLLIASALRFGRVDLSFCLFLQTMLFVMHNKVCTGQYFVWYLSLLPLVASRLRPPFTPLLSASIMWLLTLGLWLFFAHRLEMQGRGVFLQVHLSGIAFYVANLGVLAAVLRNRGVCVGLSLSKDPERPRAVES